MVNLKRPFGINACQIMFGDYGIAVPHHLADIIPVGIENHILIVVCKLCARNHKKSVYKILVNA